MKPFPVQYEKMFQATFKISLRKFYHPLWGFDMIVFNRWLTSHHGYDIKASGKSTSEFVTEIFGEAATKMILALCEL